LLRPLPKATARVFGAVFDIYKRKSRAVRRDFFHNSLQVWDGATTDRGAISLNIIAKSNLRNNVLNNHRPQKSGSGQSIRIFIGCRTFAHTRLARRCYFLAINREGKRVAGSDFLLSRSTTHAQALQFAKIQAERWQSEANYPDAVIVYLRPDFEQRRMA
jgi:hypothetical protein